MGNGRHYLTAATSSQVGKHHVNDRSPDIGEAIAIEEQERSPAMALPQKLYGFGE
jgi:hypothetical protein